jgi:hypothetical protein
MAENSLGGSKLSDTDVIPKEERASVKKEDEHVERLYSRREFGKEIIKATKKVGALLIVSSVSQLLNACDAIANMATPVGEIKANTPPTQTGPANIIPADTVESIAPAETTTPLTERLATLEPTNGWEAPGIEKRKALLADPKTFTEPLGPSGIKIITPQFDDNQYKRLDPKYLDEFRNADYEGNSCGEAVIAEVLKTYTYFKTGDVPDITIADVINYLMDIKFQGYRLIRPNATSMGDDPFKWGLEAMEHFGKETNLYTVTQLSPDWGLDKTSLIPASQWAGLFRTAREESLDKGGVLVARVLKYGRPPGTEGHFIMMSSLNANSEPLIVDSIGSNKDGDARVIELGDYVEESAGQPGLLWMAEITPTF